MSLERSGVVVATQLPPRHEQGSHFSRLVVGQLLRLIVDTADTDGVAVRLGNGQLLRLAGLDGALQPGDVLLLRVLTIAPRLELALLKTAAIGAPPLPGAEPPAMRLDQASLQQQVATSIQDAATLALSWRAMALAQLEQQLLLRAQANRQHVPGSLFGSDVGATLLREAWLMQPGVEMASWIFSAYVWAGRRVLLSLLASEEEATQPAFERRDCIVLRLQLMLPGAGMAKLQLRLVAGGIWLDLAAEREAARNVLRCALRRIVAVVARAELRVVRCRLGRVLPESGSAIDLALATNASSRLMFPPALFRAAAELALLLANPLPDLLSNPSSDPSPPALADRADDADLALLRDLVIRQDVQAGGE